MLLCATELGRGLWQGGLVAVTGTAPLKCVGLSSLDPQKSSLGALSFFIVSVPNRCLQPAHSIC